MATASEISTFIQRLGGLAVTEANRRIASGKGFVLPSVCIAQSAIETGWGTAGIMTRANAFFGIKAGGSWTGSVYRADTWEVANGEAYNTTANFRAYPSLEASVRDYFDLIGNNSRYANALSFGKDRSKWKTARACITAIWAGGYATDTLYVEKIMNTINARDLTSYDQLVTGEGAPATDDYTLSTHTITKADLVPGVLVISDAGRSIANDKTLTTAVSLDWSKAKNVNATGYKIYGTLDYDVQFAYLSGEMPTISPPVKEGAPVPMGDKVGFMLKKSDGSALTLAELPDNFTVTFAFDFISFPDGSERYSTPIANFIEIKPL